MMPLTMAKVGEENVVKRVGGSEAPRLFLAKLGFVPGSHVAIVNRIGGNLIVHVKESRVAISREMATQIMV